MLHINGIPAPEIYFAYDGCHKIYLIEDDKDDAEARAAGYEIKPIKELEKVYEESCELRFISNWKLTKFYAQQYEKAIFWND